MPIPQRWRSKPRSWRRSKRKANIPTPWNTGRARQRLMFEKAHTQSRPADKTCQSFTEMHPSTRCGVKTFCRTYPCLLPISRRSLTQSSSVTNE